MPSQPNPHRYQQLPPRFTNQPTQPMTARPPVPNMWVQGHGPAIPPPPFPVPPPYPEAAPVARKRPGNPAAIAAILFALLGLLLSTVPLLKALAAVIALACGLLGEYETRKHDALQGKLALLGALIGLLELVALFT